MLNILYISFHSGTHINFDAVCENNNWNVTHLMPPHDYYLDRITSEKIFNECYKNIIFNGEFEPVFSHIIISDTITCSYPFMKNIDMLKNIKIILQVTNYFDYNMKENSEYYEDLRNFVLNENVFVYYVDNYIKKYLEYYNIIPKYLNYIPLSGCIGKKFHDTLTPSIKDIKNLGYDIYYPVKAPYIRNNNFFTIYKGFNSINNFCNGYMNYNMQNIISIHEQNYGGINFLKNYLGCVYIPYHYSTMSFKEFLSAGFIMLIPTKEFCKILFTRDNEINLDLCDYYLKPVSDIVIYFNSYEELITKINYLNLHRDESFQIKNKIKNFMEEYDLNIFKELYYFIEQPNTICKYKGYITEVHRELNTSRFNTFFKAIEYLKTIDNPIIVELGTSRSFVSGYLNTDKNYWKENKPKNWDYGAGIFTYLFAEALQHKNFTIYSVDIDSEAIEVCKVMTNKFKNIKYLIQPSTEFLKSFKDKCHLIYMDHGETSLEVQDLHLTDAHIIIDNNMVVKDGIILIDDNYTHIGKGVKSCRLFTENNYDIENDEYQILLRKL